ncbi:tail fiber domain-containing protein [Patescibacteria group bacterium]|nr:tail fiber domain-containing protein [Patescibacteria group bacterium]MBU1673009.1 tail fiber domain-containing protein [Patescibacteria group bacterium]MBU1964168.1 tail fiber domain-containing protein [Patescibacteria group bacterium]
MSIFKFPAKSFFLLFLMAGFFIFMGNTALADWVEPTCNPTVDPDACNIAAPLNVSSAEQGKAGILNLQSTLNVQNGLVVGSGYFGSDTAPADGMIVEGNVGMGTSGPVNKLDVGGGVAIGTGYSGTRIAPTDGMIIEGKTSIGTYTTLAGYQTYINGGIDSGLYSTGTGSYGIYSRGGTYGVRGYSTGTYGGYFQGATYGVRGYSTGTYGGHFQGGEIGVRGYTTGQTGGQFIGESYGAYGSSTTGTGVYGTSQDSNGVYGTSVNGTGVYGNGLNQYGGYFQGGTAGVYGLNPNKSAPGVHGVNNNGVGGPGVKGEGQIGGEFIGASQGITASGDAVGASGSSNAGDGVRGGSSTGVGVRGTASGTGTGIFGLSNNGIGIRADTADGTAVEANVGAEGGIGIHATVTDVNSNAILADGGPSTAVYATSTADRTIEAYAEAGKVAVYGEASQLGFGVEGVNLNGRGVHGYGNWIGVFGENPVGGAGVFGQSQTGPGISGSSVDGEGIYGLSTNNIGVSGSGGNQGGYFYNSPTAVYATGANYGVNGISSAANSWGIYCEANGAGSRCGGNKAWTNTSDGRKKENVYTIDSALEKVMKLRGVTFNWKGQDYGKTEMGFIAQEVLASAPEVVSVDNEGFYTMQSSQLTALLTEAIKEQQGQIEALKVIVCSDHPDQELCHEE